MTQLEKYFDEKQWNEVVETCLKYFKEPINLELLELIKDERLALVIQANLAKQSKSWLNKKVPALDNLTPLECIKNEVLLKRLKVCLMRMK